MSRVRFLIIALGCSVALLFGHFALMRASEPFDLRVSLLSLGFLGYLREVGLPTLDHVPSEVDSNSTADFPFPTTLGQTVILLTWWLSYLALTLLVLALYRFVRSRLRPA